MFVLGGIALIVIALTAVAFVRRREPVIPVQLEKVARRNLTELVIATGKINAVLSVMINPEVSGEIILLPVEEGQKVKKGDVLVRIKPDNYIATRNSARANYQSSLANRNLAKANLDKAELECQRNQRLFDQKLISDSAFLLAKTDYEVAKASYETSGHQAEQAQAALARTEDDLSKTTILSPLDGSVINRKSQAGERVVGTAMMAGTEIMTVADLDNMEARVDIGEMDIPLIRLGQKARLEVDAFPDRKFTGHVTEIANAAKTLAPGTQQEATKFQVKILVDDKEAFRPGMSVTAEIETRYRTNVLTVPIQSVTTRAPKGKQAQTEKEKYEEAQLKSDSTRKTRNDNKPVEVVFIAKSGRVKAAPVKRGISDEDYTEIETGVSQGDDVVAGGYKAIQRELEDGKRIRLEKPKQLKTNQP